MYILKFLIFHLLVLFFINQCTFKNKYIENNKEKSVHETNIKLKKIWTTFIEKDKNYYSYLTPIMINNLIFIPNQNGIIKVINKYNGDIKRKINLNTKIKNKKNFFISSGLSTDGENIYFGSELSKIYAIDQSGSVIWETNLIGEASSPVIDKENELIFVHTENDMLYALKKDNGKIYWLINFESKELSIKGNSTPLILNNELGIVSTNNGYIIMFKLDNGEIVWKKNIFDFLNENGIDSFLQDIDITPIIKDNVLYVASYNGQILALDLFSGSTIWTKNIFSTIRNIFIENNILSIIQNNGIIFSLDINTGNIIWKQNLFLYHNLLSINLYKNYLFIKDSLGYIYIININNGLIISRKKISTSHSKTHFFFEENILFSFSQNGKISAFKIQIKN